MSLVFASLTQKESRMSVRLLHCFSSNQIEQHSIFSLTLHLRSLLLSLFHYINEYIVFHPNKKWEFSLFIGLQHFWSFSFRFSFFSHRNGLLAHIVSTSCALRNENEFESWVVIHLFVVLLQGNIAYYAVPSKCTASNMLNTQSSTFMADGNPIFWISFSCLQSNQILIAWYAQRFSSISKVENKMEYQNLTFTI